MKMVPNKAKLISTWSELKKLGKVFKEGDQRKKSVQPFIMPSPFKSEASNVGKEVNVLDN